MKEKKAVRRAGRLRSVRAKANGRKSLADRAAWADRLYRQFAIPLETSHVGEYVAIAEDGQTIVGRDDIAVLRDALAKFGKGRFAFFKVGSDVLGKWRRGPR